MNRPSLRGQTAIVTGGAQGIGAAVTEQLCADGCRVIIFDSDSNFAQAQANRLCLEGNAAWAVAGDVMDETAVAAMFRNVPKQWTRPTLLVNLVAGFVFKGIHATTTDWRHALDPTIIGLANVTRNFVASLPEHHLGGAIVNMASISAHVAQEGYLTYNTAKAAILGFTRCTAQELAPLGIRVNSVSPGTVWTANNAAHHRVALGLDRAAAEAAPEHGGKFLLQRFADPAEIAAPIAFLLSDEASYITGVDLPVDGGYLAV